MFRRIASAIFYGVASFIITLVNKTVLTTYAFSSFQVILLGQMLTTITVLFIVKKIKLIDFPNVDQNTFRKIWPLPIIHMGNIFFGLGGTKELHLQMFTALRLFSSLMTMIVEYYILNIIPSVSVHFSVYTITVGAVIAAADLGLNNHGYIYVMISDIYTAAYGVYIKQKFNSKELSMFGLMYYNSLFMFIPSLFVAYLTNDLTLAYNYTQWFDSYFLFLFSLSCVMGLVLSYSIILCTYYNSALTTTIIGCLKNACLIGMMVGGDYVFSVINLIGINLTLLGSLVYTYVIFKKRTDPVRVSLS